MIGRLFSVVLDCPDPRALAQFYSQLLGLPITRAEPDWAQIGDTHSGRLSFQRVPRYQPSRWAPRACLAPSRASASTPTRPGTRSASAGKPRADNVDKKTRQTLP
jgi:Glyoxalase-like domain